MMRARLYAWILSALMLLGVLGGLLAWLGYTPTRVYAAGYYVPITITTSLSSPIYNYSLELNLSALGFTGWGSTAPNGSDIYFLDANGNPLYYWIQEYNSTTQQGIIWVNTTLTNTTIYMYYGSINPYSAYNDPSRVFLFYDGFEGSTKWTLTTNAALSTTYSHTGSYSVKLPGNTGSNEGISRTVVTSSIMVFDEWIYFTGDSQGHLFAFKSGTSWVGPHTAIGQTGGTSDPVAGDEGYVYYYNGTWVDTNYYVAPNEWHHFEIIIDLNTQTFDLYVDGKLVVDGAGFIASMTAGSSYTLISDVNGIVGTFPDWYVDDTYQRKYVDPSSYSVSMGAPVSLGGVSFYGTVTPSSVNITLTPTLNTSSVTFTMNVTNTGTLDSWCIAEITNSTGGVLYSQNVTLAVNQSVLLNFTYNFTLADRGDYVWFFIVKNDTRVFVNTTITISVHLNLTLEYSYTLNLTATQTSYTIPPNPVKTYLWGTEYSMTIQTNATGTYQTVYSVSGGTVYSLRINFVLINTSLPWVDTPDTYVKIYDADTGALVANIYVPQGNTSVILYAGKWYKVVIPSTGTTTHGYYFVLWKWVVAGLVNATTFYLSNDETLTIYYNITNQTVAPTDPVSVTVQTQGFTAGSTFYGTIWGGDEYYYQQKMIDGLVKIIPATNITGNVLDLGTSLQQALVQVGLGFNLQDYGLPSTGVGVSLNGYYSQGLAVLVNDTTIYAALIHWNDTLAKYQVDTIIWSKPLGTVALSPGKVYFKLGYVNGVVVVAIDVVGLETNTWFVASFNYQFGGITHICLVNVPYVLNTQTLVNVTDDMIIMRGDYIRVVCDQPVFYVELNGTDRLGRLVDIKLGNNAPQDADPSDNVLELAALPVLYPVNGSLTVIMPLSSASIDIDISGTLAAYDINITNLLNISSLPAVNQTGLASVKLPIPADFERYRDVIAVLVIFLLMMIANEMNAPFFALAAAGALGLFWWMGWLNIPGAAIGLVIIVALLALSIRRPNP